MSDPVHGSAEWIKAEQAKVVAGSAEKDTRPTGLWIVGLGCGLPVAFVLIFVVVAIAWNQR